MTRLLRFLITGDWHLHQYDVEQTVGVTYFKYILANYILNVPKGNIL